MPVTTIAMPTSCARKCWLFGHDAIVMGLGQGYALPEQLNQQAFQRLTRRPR